MTTRSNNKKCNKEEIQATKDFVNYEKKWPTLSPQTSVNKSEELLEKNSKMSRLVVYMSFHFLGVLFLIYFPIYSIIMALCKTCDMPNCLHCVHCSSCHKYIQSPNDSSCYSNQQQPKTSTSFTCSACVSSTIPF